MTSFTFNILKVWVLDATPGKVRAGGDGEDHPGELIAFLSRLPNQVGFYFSCIDLYFNNFMLMYVLGLFCFYGVGFVFHVVQVSSKQEIVDALVREGFSLDVARVC